jgi:hypothetical protein
MNEWMNAWKQKHFKQKSSCKNNFHSSWIPSCWNETLRTVTAFIYTMHACMYISMYGFGVKVGNGSEVSGGEGQIMILSIHT